MFGGTDQTLRCYAFNTRAALQAVARRLILGAQNA